MTSLAEFRDELRSWLRVHPAPDVEVAATVEDADALRAWQRALAARSSPGPRRRRSSGAPA